jgi:hypothetical protein
MFYLQMRMLLPVLIQNKQQLLGATEGEHGDQTRPAARHDALHGVGES